MILYAGLAPDQGLDLGIESVGHQLKFSVWRDKGNGPVILKPGESDTLMKLDILHFDRLAPGSCGTVSDVETE